MTERHFISFIVSVASAAVVILAARRALVCMAYEPAYRPDRLTGTDLIASPAPAVLKEIMMMGIRIRITNR